MKCNQKDCPDWNPDKEECEDCIDGRFIGAVCEHASTCDGCGELTAHEEMTMEENQLGYCEKCQTKRNPEALMEQPPFFVLPDQMKALKTANEDGTGKWTMFNKSWPPIDEPIWIADSAGGIGFGCRRDYGLFAMCFKSRVPIAWKKRTIEDPGMTFE